MEATGLANGVVADSQGKPDVDWSVWQRLVHPVLRYGITPYLVVADCLAFLVAVTAVKLTSLTLRVLLPVILLLYATGGLHRSRLNLSALDDLPGLVGRAFAAAAVVTWLGALASHLYVSEMLRCAAFFCRHGRGDKGNTLSIRPSSPVSPGRFAPNVDPRRGTDWWPGG
jgi:hypothetical protein